MKNKRTHRESYERAVSPRARKLAEGVGLPLPTWVEDFGALHPPETVDLNAANQSIAAKLAHAAGACIQRVLDK